MTRSRRWPFLALSGLGLALGLWGAALLPRLSQPAAGTPGPREWPVRIDGIGADTPAELRFRLESHPAGGEITLQEPSGERMVRLVPQLTRGQWLLTLVDGLFFLAVNLLVFALRPDRANARPFYWLTLVAGVSILIGGLYCPRGPTWPGAALALVWIGCLTLLPFCFLQMSLVFPRRRDFLARHPRLLPALGAVAGALIVWQAVAYLRYFAAPGPAAWRAARLPRELAQVYLVVGVAVGFLLLFQGTRLLDLTRERTQLKWLLWGFAIGVTPYVFLRTLPQLLGAPPPFGIGFDRVCEMTVPVAFMLAVARWQFLDIDIVIRRSLIYTLLAGALVAVYLLIAVLVGARVRALAPATGPYIPIAATLLSTSLFVPTRRVLAVWVDTTFFKIRHDHAQALAALKAALPDALDPNAVATRLCACLERALQPRRVGLVDAGGRWLASSDGGSGGPPDLAGHLLAQGDAGPQRLWAAPDATSLPERECASFPAGLRAADARLVAPLRARAAPLGWLVLAGKRSERRYVQEDLELIEQAAAVAAVALERIELVRQVAREEAARRRLDELDRLKTDFLSRVAHDLRTPVASIAWSAANLLDGVVGEPDPRQVDSLLGMKAAAGQLDRLVSNLLEISRLELGREALVPEAVDLGAVVREAATALSPLAQTRRVRFAVNAPAAVPAVRGSREKLGEVVANLLENALKYSPDGGRIEVALAPDPASGVRLTVRDHGPGLAAGEADFIFERFRQGRPSPHAQPGGFGLGLYVVRSYVQLMNGSVAAENAGEGGALFTCLLPAWPA